MKFISLNPLSILGTAYSSNEAEYRFVVRKETPDDIVSEINSKLKETLADQEVIDALKKIGTNTMYLDNKQFDAVIKKELEFYK